MSAQVRLVHGDPETVPYTPGGAIAAGDVIVIGDTPMVAPSSLAAGQAGSLCSRGGVYSGPADGAIGGGKNVYWNAGTHKFTLTQSTNKGFGYTEPQSTAAADGDIIRVCHAPFLSDVDA